MRLPAASRARRRCRRRSPGRHRVIGSSARLNAHDAETVATRGDPRACAPYAHLTPQNATIASVLTNRYHALRICARRAARDSSIARFRIPAAGVHDAFRAQLGGRGHDQRDRVPGALRARRSDDGLHGPGVRRRRDPELDPQSPLDVEGRGTRGVRTRDPRLRRDLARDAADHRRPPPGPSGAYRAFRPTTASACSS